MEWNKVTWYSWVAAIVIFVGVFALGIWLGMQIKDQQMGSSAQTVNSASSHNAAGTSSTTAAGGVIANVTYSCEDGKKVQAIYSNGKVQVSTSDGTSITLPQTISADGGRYANSDESFVFWSKGNGAFIMQTTNGVSTTTYANCTQVSSTK